MKKEEIVTLLKKGFNAQMLADAFNCSIGRINELKCEPVEGEVYHKDDINANALLGFAEKHDVDLDAIDFESIVANARKPKAEKAKIEVGSNTVYGVVEEVQKIGQSFVYLIRTKENKLVMKSTKDLK